MKNLKIIIVAFVFATFIFACNSSSKSSNKLKYTIVSLADSSQNYTKDTTIDLNVHITFYNVQGEPQAIADSLNNAFFGNLSMYLSDTSVKVTAANMKDQVAAYIKNYIRDLNEDEYLMDCEACRNGELTIDTMSFYQNSEVASTVYSIYSYSGGAHGSDMIYALNYSKTDTSYISLANLSNNIDELTKIGEKAFVNQNGKVEDFWFDDQKFKLPETFYFTDSTLVFYYQTYEIASYAEGNFSVVLKNKDIKNLVKYVE